MKRTPFICMVIATIMEAEPFINLLGLEETGDQPFPVYKGDDVLLIISGIGKANAAMATTYACSMLKPEWILNLGAAGATDVSRVLGSIYQIEKILEPDRPHLRTNTPYIQVPDLLPGFPTSVLATQDKAVTTIEDFREIAQIADLVDMEGASVLQAGKRFDTKCLLFKFVSDTPEHAGQGQIIEQIKDYRDPFCKFIIDSVIPAIRKVKQPEKQLGDVERG